MKSARQFGRVAMAAATIMSALTGEAVWAGTLRVVEYNVNADTTALNGFNNALATYNDPFGAVVNGIGQHALAGHAQPVDVLALTELAGASSTTLSSTLGAVVTDLNKIYGPGTYAYDTTPGRTDGQTLTGNGPSGLVYNTRTVGNVAGFVLNNGSSKTDPRSPIRYAITPVGGSPASPFYLYVEHSKAQAGPAEADVRAAESNLVRQDAATLGTTASIIYAGDLNLAGNTTGGANSGSLEAAYKNLTAAAGATLSNSSGGALGVAGAGEAVDPLDPTETFRNNSTVAANVRLYTESATRLTARFDLQLVTRNVLTGAGSAGLTLVPNTMTAFGNSYYNGSVLTTGLIYNGPVTANTAAGAINPALFDLNNEANVLTALTQVSDHLPIVADYTFADLAAAPEPTTLLTLGVASLTLLLPRRRRRLGQD